MVLFLLSLITSAQATFISSPYKCVENKKYPCVVQTKSKTSLQMESGKFYLSSNALVSFTSPNEFYVVRGLIWGIAKHQVTFKTTFGSFTTNTSGTEYWITASKASTLVRVFVGEVEVVPRGGVANWIHPGKEVQVSYVDFSSRSCFASNPLVIDMYDYVHDFSRVFPFGTASVEDHLNSVAKTILTASSQDSLLLRQSVSRQLASDIAEDARLKVERAKASQLEIYLRKLFRAKSNFED